jgi:hypothetical protein
MSERSITISDSLRAGYQVATRDAYEPDAGGNARVVQLVDLAARRIESVRTLRGETAAVDAADGLDLGDLADELRDNRVWLGDCGLVTVLPEHAASDGSVEVTPVLFDEADNVVGVLASQTSTVGGQFRRGASGNYLSPLMAWEPKGAAGVGLHVTTLGGTSNAVVLKGGAISEAAWPAVLRRAFAQSLADQLLVVDENWRLRIDAATLERAGNRLRLRFGYDATTYSVQGWVGKPAASGDDFDFDPASMQQITFDDGAVTVKSITARTWSDEIALDLTDGSDLLIALYNTVSGTIPMVSPAPSGTQVWDGPVGSDDTSTADAASGDYFSGSPWVMVERIETRTVEG